MWRARKIRPRARGASGQRLRGGSTASPEKQTTSQIKPICEVAGRLAISGLELVPQELVGDFVVELHFGRFNERAEFARATIG
jgi:hypothetical protein